MKLNDDILIYFKGDLARANKYVCIQNLIADRGLIYGTDYIALYDSLTSSQQALMSWDLEDAS